MQRLQINDGDIFKAIEQGNLATDLAKLPTNTHIKLKVDSFGKVQSLKVPLTNKTNSANDGVGETLAEVPVLVFVLPSDQPNQFKVIRLSEKTQVRVVNKSAPFDGNFF